MNEKKWRLIDDDVVVSLIYDFKVEESSNGVIEWRTTAGSNTIAPALQYSIASARA
jgi:hypothetical protein